MFCQKSNDLENYEYSFFTKSEIILGTTNLTENQKILFRRRIMKKLYNLRKIKNIYSILFYLHKFLSTTLGVIIPALLSIQYYYQSGDDGLNNPIYWNAWGLSLAGAFVNGYANIFKVDQRFTLLKMIYQKLKFEIWSFLILCNHYDIQSNNKKLTHQEVFQNFFENFENFIDNFKNTEIDTLTKKNEKQDEITPREVVLNDPPPIETPRQRIFNEIDVNVLSPESQELYHRFVHVMSQHLN